MALGTHIVGSHATELMAGFIVGRHLESTIEEMDRVMHPHSTLSEAIGEAALAGLGHALHI